MSSRSEMSRNDYLKICNLVIELKKLAEEYDMKEITYAGIKITISEDKDRKLIVE